MAIHVALHHKTHYTYDRSVSHGPHVIRLRPAPHCRTRILSYSQRVSGGKHFINWQQYPFSNWNARLVFPEPMNELCIEVDLVAEMAVYNPFDFFLEDYATHFPFSYEAGQRKNLGPFLDPCFPGPRLSSLIMRVKLDILGHPERLGQAPTPDSLRRLDVHHDGGHIAAGIAPPQGEAMPGAERVLAPCPDVNRCARLISWWRSTAGGCPCIRRARTARGWRACATVRGSRRSACIPPLACIRR